MREYRLGSSLVNSAPGHRDLIVGCAVGGLHAHSGSGILDETGAWANHAHILAEVAQEHFPTVKFLDIGGGLGIPYRFSESVRLREASTHEIVPCGLRLTPLWFGFGAGNRPEEGRVNLGTCERSNPSREARHDSLSV